MFPTLERISKSWFLQGSPLNKKKGKQRNER
jgi:hypothetical protein